jgi:anti-anti-sigma regulatory factor
MSIRLETDRSGRRVLLTVADDHHSAAALAELLAALHWTRVDEILVDLSQLDTIDMRVAVVLAKAVRHHGDIGRRVCLICPRDEAACPLRTFGLDDPGTICSSLTDAGWYAGHAPGALTAVGA